MAEISRRFMQPYNLNVLWPQAGRYLVTSRFLTITLFYFARLTCRLKSSLVAIKWTRLRTGHHWFCPLLTYCFWTGIREKLFKSVIKFGTMVYFDFPPNCPLLLIIQGTSNKKIALMTFALFDSLNSIQYVSGEFLMILICRRWWIIAEVDFFAEAVCSKIHNR